MKASDTTFTKFLYKIDIYNTLIMLGLLAVLTLRPKYYFMSPKLLIHHDNNFTPHGRIYSVLNREPLF